MLAQSRAGPLCVSIHTSLAQKDDATSSVALDRRPTLHLSEMLLPLDPSSDGRR